jgi:LPXTG-motif cell wall-anchored protein
VRGLMKLWMAIGAVLVAVGALGNMPSASAASAAGAAAAEPSNIQIVQTPSGGGGICLPPALAMRQSTRSDATTFRLIIRVTAPLCARVNAVAAIYKMPGNGVAWPQTLLETAPFSLREPGTTEVIFTKTCTPAQFDVITGATPPVISPTGPWHGPLLFPFDTSTSLQWFGCGPTTSTSTTSTSTSTTTTTIDDNCENYTPGNVTVTPTSARAGDTLSVRGTGTPGTLIQVLLRPPTGGAAAEQLSAAEATAGFVALSDPALVQPDGTWSTTLIVPSDAPPGTWTVAANAVGCETEVTTQVTIVAGAVVPSTPSTEGPVVAGETVSNTVAGASATSGGTQAAGLAFTGTSTHLPIIAGILMIMTGGLLLLSTRRRRRMA